jgi:hypothetical protein
MDRLDAINIIKNMCTENITKDQLKALEIACHDMELRIKKDVKGKTYLSDKKLHFYCPHCSGLIRPDTSERICRLCGGEVSWQREIKKGNVFIISV